MSIDVNADMTQFFRDRLCAAMERQSLRVHEVTEWYLVQLLTDYANMPADRALSRPLVERMAEALEADGTNERFRRFRELGDSALYVCGFFSDHVQRRGISRDYVVAMGGRAYVAAGDLLERGWAGEPGFGQVYPELAECFDDLARVLDDVRECTALRTPQDIVRLYERWQKTGSPLLAERLEAEGVFPQANESKMVH